MTEAEEIAYYTDKDRFPDKLLADGKTYSTQKRLSGGAWVRVRSYDMKIWRWTYNGPDGKRDIIGIVQGHDFLTMNDADWKVAYEYERGKRNGQGIMELA